VSEHVQKQRLSRRAFLRNGTLVLTAAALPGAPFDPQHLLGDDDKEATPLRVALLTDLHYADKPAAGTRHYRQTLDKLAEAAGKFAEQRPDVLVELGDFIDAADSVEVERSYLRTVNRPFAAICKDRHYVLGNHCVDTLKKEEFLEQVEQERSYYSFERGGVHFVVLDSCFRSDGEAYGRKNFHWTDANIPAAELEWLASDLQQSDRQVIVFAHQRLDVSNNHGVKNNAEVRRIFEASGRVRAVFQGHSHKNELKEIGGIPYCTLVAMVEGAGAENSGYSMMEIDSDFTIRVSGFRRQDSYLWEKQG
jgi:predicted phosphodiesterase